MELAGKIALITGSAQRIGAGLALALAQRGAHIALHYGQSHQAAAQLAEQIGQLGGKAATFAADLADPAQAAALPQRVADTLGVATILINNAAIFQTGLLTDTPHQQWHQHLAINLTAPFLLTQAFAKLVSPQQGGLPWAKVINMVDQRIAHPHPGHLAYTIAKSGLWTLTTLCAQELAPAILVNGVAPGPILPANQGDLTAFQKIAAATPAGRPGSVNDVIAAVLFLLEQDYVTGQMIQVDGGQHLT